MAFIIEVTFIRLWAWFSSFCSWYVGKN